MQTYSQFELDWVIIGLNRFGFDLVRFISHLGLHWANKISSPFRFSLGHYGYQVKLGQQDFGLARIWFKSLQVLGQYVRFRFSFELAQFRVSG